MFGIVARIASTPATADRTRGPFGYDVPSDALISDHVAISSLSILIVSMCICLGTMMVLSRRIWKHGTRRYISSDSSIRLMTIRLYGIFFAGCLLMGDMINNLCHVWLMWKLRSSMFFWYRIGYVITYPPVVAIGTYAVAQRCAMIVVRDSRWRKRFLKWTLRLCVLVLSINSPAAVILALDLQATTTNPHDWTEALLTPLWTFPIFGTLPVVNILGALASLRESLKQDVIILHDGQSTAQASMNSVDHSQADQSHPGPAKPGQGAPPGPMQSNRPTASNSAPDAVAIPARMPSTMSGLLLVHLPSRPSISMGKLPAPGTTDTGSHAEFPAVAVRRREANRPLTLSFRWLTSTILVLWTLGFTLTLLKPWHPVLTSAINSALTVAGLVTEVSFERVLRIHNQRLRRRSLAVQGVTTMGVDAIRNMAPECMKAQGIRGTAVVEEPGNNE